MCRHTGTLPHVLHWANPSPAMASPGASAPAPHGDCPWTPATLSSLFMCGGGWGGGKARGPGCFADCMCEVLAAPAVSPRPGHRLLWANKPQAEVQLVTGVPRLPQPRGRNTVSQVQAPARPGCRWVGTPAGPPRRSKWHEFRCSQPGAGQGAGKSPPLPARSRQLTAADSHCSRGNPEGTPALCIGGVQWGPHGSWCPSSTPAPRLAPGVREDWGWSVHPVVPARITISRWGGRGGQDLTPHGDCGRACRCSFFPRIFPAWRGT